MAKRKIFGILIILIGLIILFIKPILLFVVDKKVDNTVDKFNNVNIEEITKNNEVEGDFDFENISEISPSKVLLNPGKIDERLIIGQLVIPSIKSNLVIFKGLSEYELYAGVGTMKPGQIMGEGNYAIAGHYAENSTLFGDLTSVKEGDIIRITDKQKIYEYKAFETRIVDPTQIHIINDDFASERGNPIISLMNCYYEGRVFTGNRFFVFGDLVNIRDYNEKDMISTKNEIL